MKTETVDGQPLPDGDSNRFTPDKVTPGSGQARPVNAVLDLLREIIARADDTYVVVGARSLPMSHPDAPVKVIARHVIARLRALV